MADAQSTTTLPTPPISPTPSDPRGSSGVLNESHLTLERELDAVLERYLELLDQQQFLQAALGKHFSSVCQSLAFGLLLSATNKSSA